MARRSKNSMTYRRSSADASANARASGSTDYNNWLRRAQDFRQWHPQTIRQRGALPSMRISRSLDGLTGPSKLVSRPIARRKTAGGVMRKVGIQKGPRFPHYGVGFAQPAKVLICVRRTRRKQVIFATGKGGARGKQRRRRNNEFSQIRC